MSTSVAEPLVAAVWCDDEHLWVRLAEGRRLGVPLGFYPRLRHASPVERANFELVGDGIGIHWPDVDEDISIAGLVAGERDNTRLGREHRDTCELCREANAPA